MLEYAVPISFSCMMCGWDGFIQRYITQRAIQIHDPDSVKSQQDWGREGARQRWEAAGPTAAAKHAAKMRAAKKTKPVAVTYGALARTAPL